MNWGLLGEGGLQNLGGNGGRTPGVWGARRGNPEIGGAGPQFGGEMGGGDP